MTMATNSVKCPEVLVARLILVVVVLSAGTSSCGAHAASPPPPVLLGSPPPPVHLSNPPPPVYLSTPPPPVYLGSPPPPVSLALVKLKFVNELTKSLKVTLGATLLGTAPSIVVPPGEARSLSIEVEMPLLRQGILFQVGSEKFFTPGSELSRILAETGTVTFYITGPCAYKRPGLQFVTTGALDVCAKLGCAAPVQR